MADTAGDVLVNVLCAWGVEVIFGLPGDGINGVMEALRCNTRVMSKAHVENVAEQIRARRGQIKWEQMVFLGNPEYAVDLQPIDFVKQAEACGASGFRIDNPADCGRILDEALAVPGPVVIEAVVDPNEPPLPPKITREQVLPHRLSPRSGPPRAGSPPERDSLHRPSKWAY